MTPVEDSLHKQLDYQTKRATIKDENSVVNTVVAGPEMRNFNQINQGDKVALHYREAVTAD